jgi:hypothetical protein
MRALVASDSKEQEANPDTHGRIRQKGLCRHYRIANGNPAGSWVTPGKPSLENHNSNSRHVLDGAAYLGHLCKLLNFSLRKIVRAVRATQHSTRGSAVSTPSTRMAAWLRGCMAGCEWLEQLGGSHLPGFCGARRAVWGAHRTGRRTGHCCDQ